MSGPHFAQQKPSELLSCKQSRSQTHLDAPAAPFFLCVLWGGLCAAGGLHNVSKLLKAETTLLLLNPYSPRHSLLWKSFCPVVAGLGDVSKVVLNARL